MREAPSSGSARRPSDASDNMPSVPDSAHVPGSEPTRGEADYDHNHVFPRSDDSLFFVVLHRIFLCLVRRPVWPGRGGKRLKIPEYDSALDRHSHFQSLGLPVADARKSRRADAAGTGVRDSRREQQLDGRHAGGLRRLRPTASRAQATHGRRARPRHLLRPQPGSRRGRGRVHRFYRRRRGSRTGLR